MPPRIRFPRPRLFSTRSPLRSSHPHPPHPPPPPPPKSAPPQTPTIDKIIARLPPRFRPAAAHLRSAPASHVVAFLLLHEITAIVPILGLFALFHWGSSWISLGWISERLGPQVGEGMVRFERYFKKKRWFGMSNDEDGGVVEKDDGDSSATTVKDGNDKVVYTVVLEVAVAYAITKVLLPVRIFVSLAATPWMARGLTRMRGLFGRSPK